MSDGSAPRRTGVSVPAPSLFAGAAPSCHWLSTLDGRPVETREEPVVVVRTLRPGHKVTVGCTRGSDEAELALGGRVG